MFVESKSVCIKASKQRMMYSTEKNVKAEINPTCCWIEHRHTTVKETEASVVRSLSGRTRVQVSYSCGDPVLPFLSLCLHL